MKMELKGLKPLDITLGILVLILIYFINDGTRLYALTIDALRYFFESQTSMGTFYAESKESYFYRILIYQSGHILKNFKLIQNFNFIVYSAIFIHISLILKRNFNQIILYFFYFLSLINIYSNGVLFVVERDILLSLMFLGFFSLIIPFSNNKHSKHSFILMLIYTFFASLLKVEGYALLLICIFISLRYKLPKQFKIKSLATTFSFILIFNFIFTHERIEDYRKDFFPFMFINHVIYILNTKIENNNIEINDKELIKRIHYEEPTTTLQLKKQVEIILPLTSNIDFYQKNNKSLFFMSLKYLLINYDLYFKYAYQQFSKVLHNIEPFGKGGGTPFFEYKKEVIGVDTVFMNSFIKELRNGLKTSAVKIKENVHDFYETFFITPLLSILSSILVIFILFIMAISRKKYFETVYTIGFLFITVFVIFLSPIGNIRYYYFLNILNPLLYAILINQLFIHFSSSSQSNTL
jgi:hypothetical protein